MYKFYYDNYNVCTEQDRDLGILMTIDDRVRMPCTFICFDLENVAKMTGEKMRWVLRVSRSRKRSLTLTLFKSLLIPLIEHLL